MGYHDDRRAVFANLLHAAVALGLEKDIPDRERLINDQDLRLDVDRKRKCQTHEHTARVRLDRLIDEVANLGKIENLRQLCIHLFFGISHHRTVHIDIFDTGVVLVKSGSQLQQRRNFAAHRHLAGRRRENAGNDLKDRRFTRTVRTDDADRLTFFNRKGKIAQRVEILVVFFMADAQRFLQPVDRFIIQPVYLGHIFHFDRVLLCVLRLLCPCVCCIFSRHISFSFLLFHYSRSIACFLCFLQFLYAEKHTSFYVLTKNIRIFL